MIQRIQKMKIRMAAAMNGCDYIISILVIIGVLAHLLNIPKQILLIQTDGLSCYLQYLFDILIAVELVKLLCTHELASMVEVVMFAVSRQVIVGHLEPIDNTVAVVSIMLLFVIRKYLFIHKETYEEEAKRRRGIQ